MEAKYIKMNNNQKELSLGNFCRIVKEQALNKSYAGQPDVFYAIFLVEDVSDSTINNYCIGYRTIASDFKNIYQKRKNYPNKEFDETIQNLIYIIKGNTYNELSHNQIVEEAKTSLKKVSIELYNIAKNDKSVSREFTKKINELIKKEKIYESICEILLFIVLEKKQPIYIDKTRREIFESMLNNTNISMNDLEQFLKIQLNDGINYTYSLKKLSKEKNPYASFELGDMEYTGIMSGSPRYIKAYEYFKIAASQNHPRANWLIGKMLLEGQIGKNDKETKEKAFKYIKKAEELGSVAATNTIGLCYLNGLIPSIPKDEEKAISYFRKAAKEDYVYAHNNLGKIYEKHGDLKKAYEHYMVGATLEESWASNKIGKWYLEGIYIEKDEKKAYDFFNKATEVPKSILDYWAYFNLAKYFYLEGNYEANIEKNISKAIEYFNKALEGNIEDAYKELIYIYIDEYKKNENQKDLDYINYYYNKYRLTNSYIKYKKEINNKIEEMVKNKIILIKND